MCLSAKKWMYHNSLFSAVLLKIICLFCPSGPTQGPQWGLPWSCSGLRSGCAVVQMWLVFSQLTSCAFVTVTWLQYYENIHIDWISTCPPLGHPLGLPLEDDTVKGVRKSEKILSSDAGEWCKPLMMDWVCSTRQKGEWVVMMVCRGDRDLPTDGWT